MYMYIGRVDKTPEREKKKKEFCFRMVVKFSPQTWFFFSSEAKKKN